MSFSRDVRGKFSLFEERSKSLFLSFQYISISIIRKTSLKMTMWTQNIEMPGAFLLFLKMFKYFTSMCHLPIKCTTCRWKIFGFSLFLIFSSLLYRLDLVLLSRKSYKWLKYWFLNYMICMILCDFWTVHIIFSK